MKKFYPNGEIITKSRIEDEDWYYDFYQPFLEYMMSYYKRRDITVTETYHGALDFFDNSLDKKNKEILLRWVVLHVERHNNMPPVEEIEKMIKSKIEQTDGEQ